MLTGLRGSIWYQTRRQQQPAGSGTDPPDGPMTQTCWVRVSRLFLIKLSSAQLASRPEAELKSTVDTQDEWPYHMCRWTGSRWPGVVGIRHAEKVLVTVTRFCCWRVLSPVPSWELCEHFPGSLRAKQAGNHPNVHLPAFIITHLYNADRKRKPQKEI